MAQAPTNTRVYGIEHGNELGSSKKSMMGQQQDILAMTRGIKEWPEATLLVAQDGEMAKWIKHLIAAASRSSPACRYSGWQMGRDLDELC